MTQYYLVPHPPVLIPAVGQGREIEIQKTMNAIALIKEKIVKDEIETIVIITPHGPIFQDAVAIVNESQLTGSLAKFGVYDESKTFEIDQTLTTSIIEVLRENDLPIVPLTHLESIKYRFDLELDHGAYVPLYYIGDSSKHKIVHLTYGMLSALELYHIGMKINDAILAANKKIAVVASGDLSHCLTKDGPYPYHPSGKKFDEALIKILQEGNIQQLVQMPQSFIKEAAECGMRSLYVLAGCLDGLLVRGTVLSYEGPFGVGYAVVEFHGEAGTSIFEMLKLEMMKKHDMRLESGNPYTVLARRNLNSFYEHGRELELTNDMDKALLECRKGVFVSLKKGGELRGCVGTFLPTTSCIAEEIIQQSLQAALNDPRFPPLQKEELPHVDISVDLLETPYQCQKGMLDPMKYGVIVSKGNKKGLLLPMLDGIDTIDKQLEVVLQKANIDKQDDYKIERFEVTRYQEVE